MLLLAKLEESESDQHRHRSDHNGNPGMKSCMNSHIQFSVVHYCRDTNTGKAEPETLLDAGAAAAAGDDFAA